MILTGDLIDIARPGEEVTIIGRYTNNFDMSLNTKNGFPVFSTVIEANNVKRENDVLGNLLLSQEDIDKVCDSCWVKFLSRFWLYQKIIIWRREFLLLLLHSSSDIVM